MADEFQIGYITGKTVYALLMPGSGSNCGKVWNGTSFESLNAANWSTYAITMTEGSTTGIYLGSVPAGAPAGRYNYLVYIQAGGSAAATDGPPKEGWLDWSGSVDMGFSTTQIAGVSFVNALRYIGAAVSGVSTGAGTGTETYDDFAGATAFVVTISSTYNRTSIIYS